MKKMELREFFGNLNVEEMCNLLGNYGMDYENYNNYFENMEDLHDYLYAGDLLTIYDMFLNILNADIDSYQQVMLNEYLEITNYDLEDLHNVLFELLETACDIKIDNDNNVNITEPTSKRKFDFNNKPTFRQLDILLNGLVNDKCIHYLEDNGCISFYVREM